MKKNYIGITGFKTIEEIQSINQITKDETHRFMYGIITSTKKIDQRDAIGRVSPSFNQISKLLDYCQESNVFGALHYYTPNQKNFLQKDIKILQEVFGKHSGLKGIQWNIEWPNPEIISQIDLEHIIQLKREMLKEPLDNIIFQINNYKELLGDKLHILIDPSGGTGTEIDISKHQKVIQCLKQANIYWGIAGGLSPENTNSKLLQTEKIAGTRKF